MTVVLNQNPVNNFCFLTLHGGSKLKVMKNILRDEFIYGGHYLSLGASAVVLSTMLILRLSIRWELLIIAYLCGMIVYGYDRYRDVTVDSLSNQKRTAYLKKCYRFLPYLLSIYVLSFFMLLFYFGTVESIFFGGLLVLVGVLYTHRLKKMTTTIVGFKTYYTSFSVASIIVFTALYCSYAFNWAVLILFVFLFLRMMIDCSFCDIKDMTVDKKNHLLTLPLVFGKEKFLNVLHVINVISCIPILLGVFYQFLSFFSVFILISVVYSFYYIQKARDTQTDIPSLISYTVDGEFLVLPIVLWIGGGLL